MVYKRSLSAILTFSVLLGIAVTGQDALPGQAAATPTMMTNVAVGTTVTDFNTFEMVYVPAGRFEMGITRKAFYDVCLNGFKGSSTQCTDLANFTDKASGIFQTHTVELPGFWMDRYEVTIKQYFPCTVPHPGRNCLKITNAAGPQLSDDLDKPQVGVNWYDAMYFCNNRGARLPTEEEWEYAAKGPNNFIFPWGNTFVERYVSPVNATYPVGSIPENKSWAGIFDMAGNAAEWVENRYLPYTPNRDWVTGSSLDTARVIRGGSWANRTLQLITADRSFANPNEADFKIGFRCARSSDPTKS